MMEATAVKTPRELSMDRAVSEFDSLPDTARVPRQVIERLLSVSRATVWNMARSGRLPKPIKEGRVTRWNVGELRAALAR